MFKRRRRDLYVLNRASKLLAKQNGYKSQEDECIQDYPWHVYCPQ